LFKQQISIKLLVKLERNATSIYKMLQQVYGKGTVNRIEVLIWC